jgi:hypothetical protein
MGVGLVLPRVVADGLWNFMNAGDCAATLEQCMVDHPQHVIDAGISSGDASAGAVTDASTSADSKPFTSRRIPSVPQFNDGAKKRKFEEFTEEEELDEDNSAAVAKAEIDKKRTCLQINSHNPCPILFPSCSSTTFFAGERDSESPLIWEKAFVPRQEYRKGAFVAFSSRPDAAGNETSQSAEGTGNLPAASTGNEYVYSRPIAKVDSLCADRRVGIMRKLSVTVDKSNMRNSRKLKGPASDLLYRCVEKAAMENGLNANDLIDNCDIEYKRTNSVIKSTRRYIDDVTIMVLELQHVGK